MPCAGTPLLRWGDRWSAAHLASVLFVSLSLVCLFPPTLCAESKDGHVSDALRYISMDGNSKMIHHKHPPSVANGVAYEDIYSEYNLHETGSQREVLYSFSGSRVKHCVVAITGYLAYPAVATQFLTPQRRDLRAGQLHTPRRETVRDPRSELLMTTDPLCLEPTLQTAADEHLNMDVLSPMLHEDQIIIAQLDDFMQHFHATDALTGGVLGVLVESNISSSTYFMYACLVCTSIVLVFAVVRLLLTFSGINLRNECDAAVVRAYPSVGGRLPDPFEARQPPGSPSSPSCPHPTRTATTAATASPRDESSCAKTRSFANIPYFCQEVP